MTLRDLLKKRDKIKDAPSSPISPPPEEQKPEFTIFRSDTNSKELIAPPSFTDSPLTSKQEKRRSNPLSRLRSASNASTTSNNSRPSSRDGTKDNRRLSGRFHIPRPSSRASNRSSVNIPTDLPEITALALTSSNEEMQAAWEERATRLVNENPSARPLSQGSLGSHKPLPYTPEAPAHLGDRPQPRGRSISDAKTDDDIQIAIQLHEAGNLAGSTAMFGRLADTNAMAQILYGLALRHGWGITADPALGITYLSRAASSSALVESEALERGKRKGGEAKGELVLAIYELANSFRHGWGVERDAVAARKYYEVAANLGDEDAMNEVGWCWEEGFGGKKDRYTAAQYYRQAETTGSKTLGNSWIWKDKYNPKSSSDGADTSPKAAKKK